MTTDAIRQAHGFGLIVRDVEDRGGEPAEESLQLAPHALPKHRIEVGERLVHQVQPGPPDEGAAQGDALLLPSRDLGRTPLEQLADTQQGRHLADPIRYLVTRQPARLQGEGEVARHAQVRIERVVLEDETDVARARRNVVEPTAVQREAARGGLLEAGDDAKKRRLAATGRPQEREHPPGRRHERNAVQGSRSVGEHLGYALAAQLGHVSP